MARRARSLDQLVAEVNTVAPHRSKTLGPDGWLGDTAHQARASRHNPNDAGVVCAQDITHDPAGGCDIHTIARALVTRYRVAYERGARTSEEYRAHGLNPDLEYVISNDQSAGRSTGWVWKAYQPTNAARNQHRKHAHFAVGRGPDSEPTGPYDDTDPWGITRPAQLPEEDDMFNPETDGKALIEVRDNARKTFLAVAGIAQKVGALDQLDDEIIAGVLAGLDPKAIAAAIPLDLAEQVADEIAERLKS